MKTIGLVAGMSWESSAHYYEILNRETARRLGGLSSARIAMYSVEFAELARCMDQGDWERVAEVLCDAARRVQRAGADVILICTNTMHVHFDRVRQSAGAPMIHIADPVARAVEQAGFSRAGLLGTSFTMEKTFFADRLAARGIKVLTPEAEDRAMVHKVIFDELCLGKVLDSSREQYVQTVNRLARRGAECAVLGCTEIAMLLDENTSPLPVFDTTRLHALAALDFALDGDESLLS